jgi:ATP-binding cassette subfamily B protein
VVEQNLRGSRVVKAYAQEPAEIARFEQQNDIWFNLSSRAARLQAVQAPLLLLIANLGTVLIIWLGGSMVVQGQLSLGELVAFTTYLALLVEPVRRLGLVIPAVSIAASSAERIFEILDAIPDVKDTPGARPLPALQGHVRFEAVSFAYGKSQKLARVLREVDFEARPGQVIALLGPTGSGKSTVISLIPRFYDPTAGRVLIDGQDIRQVTIQSLRKQIGIVMQETILFAASVRENIAFGRPEAAESEIIAAAQAAQAHSFIERMPQGYSTRIGERGVTLSGGQKQRLAIARALLMDPRILILDDATASVDTATESQIQQAFVRLMQGRTTFVIAHRLSTVRRADLVLVLDNGRIAACGTHETLLASSALYAQIYQKQLAPQEGLAMDHSNQQTELTIGQAQ